MQEWWAVLFCPEFGFLGHCDAPSVVDAVENFPDVIFTVRIWHTFFSKATYSVFKVYVLTVCVFPGPLHWLCNVLPTELQEHCIIDTLNTTEVLTLHLTKTLHHF